MSRRFCVFRLSRVHLVPMLLAAALVHGGWTNLSAAEEPAPNTSLPLQRVVLFSSGVGYYEHLGEIEGDARVDLKFNVKDINDLLKSMVLQDFGGGKISTINYGSKDPITKTLKSFAIDLTTSPTLADLLRQIRGEKIQVEAADAINGTILGVETRAVRVTGGNEVRVIEQHFLNLLTDDGLRSVNLETLSKIKLLDPKLNAELQQALALLAGSHDHDKKSVALNFLGAGKRPVRVGYVQESPVWKTSYRLVLGDDKAPYLQGWAIVENTTEQDWNDVNLTLVSGRPISFMMDLYQPLYVQRPLVVPELYASLRPQTYSQDLAARDQEFRRNAIGNNNQGAALRKQLAGNHQPSENDPFGENFAKQGGGGMGGFGGGGNGRAGSGPTGFVDAVEDRTGRPAADRSFNPAEGVQSLAQAGDVGEMFQYAIGTPVKLPRQQSAMLPIVNDSVEGKKVSIYNPAVHPKHPLNGLKLKNSTKFHLMQGPITVFDDGAYAGDARIEDLPPGTERLISYALDLDTEVAPEAKTLPEEVTSVKIVKGVLHTARRLDRSVKFVIKNSGKRAKTVLIESPLDPAWKLIQPEKPSETTRSGYRFEVTAEPGKSTELVVKEQRTESEQVALTNLDTDSLRFYLKLPVISPEIVKAMQEIIARNRKIGLVQAKRAGLEQEIQIVEQEQNRIRQNMAQLERTNDLYKRYVKMFGEQEDQIAKLRPQIVTLKEEELQLNQDLTKFLIELNLGGGGTQ